MKPRPVLRYHGGKWLLAPWLIEHFPPHRIYVSAYGGAASDLMRKPRSYAEVYNEKCGDVVNLFRVLRAPTSAAKLIDALHLTPFARDEFELSYQPTRNTVERARRLIIRSFMGFGSGAASSKSVAAAGFRHMGIVHKKTPDTGFRANSNRSGTTPSHDWANYPDSLRFVVERLRGITIENRDAIECMRQHDSPDTLHYCDPPYLKSTRTDAADDYRFEMSETQHAELLSFLQTLTGMVVLSGYPSALYDAALQGWRRVERQALADGAAARTEVLWINPLAALRHDAQLPMFQETA